MTIRHHHRDGQRFAKAFGCELRCHVDGLHEFADGLDVRGFDVGDENAPGVTALEADAISPDESALDSQYGGDEIAFGEGLIRPRGRAAPLRPGLSDRRYPERVKRELSAAFDRLLGLEFDTLLFAHGDPLVSGGKQPLRDFVCSRETPSAMSSLPLPWQTSCCGQYRRDSRLGRGRGVSPRVIGAHCRSCIAAKAAATG